MANKTTFSVFESTPGDSNFLKIDDEYMTLDVWQSVGVRLDEDGAIIEKIHIEGTRAGAPYSTEIEVKHGE